MAEAALREDRYIYSNPLPETVDAGAVPKAVPRAIPRPAIRPRISAFSVLGFLFIAFLTVICVYSQIELTKISSEITGVKAVKGRVEGMQGITQKLEEQIAENNALCIEYERVFDLKEIEIYATQVLGMVRSQTAAENTEVTIKSDRAVIPASAKKSGGIKGVFEWVTEYFA